MEDEDFLWKEVLAEKNKQRVVTRLREKQDDDEEWPSKDVRQAAVLVPLVFSEGSPSILFTVRSQLISRHRNQVSFPGGLADPEDSSPEATALREAWEELGIRSHDVEVWGRMNSFPDRMKSSLVTPVLGFIQNFSSSSLRLSHAEVQGVFTLPLQHLANPANSGYTRFTRNRPIRFPMFLGGPKKIWGLTGFVLEMTLINLLPSKHYTPVTSRR